MRVLLLLFLGLASTPRSESTTRPPAESFGYEVYWGGMVVGHARIEVLPTTDSTQFALRTTARANNAIQSLYPVHDTVESWVSVATGLPLRFHKRLNEGSYSASTLLFFNHETGNASVRGGQKKGGTRDTVVTIPDGTYDILSAFHSVRQRKLVPGTSLTLPILDNRKVFKSVEIACLRRETIEQNGSTYKTLVIEPRLHGEALFKSKGKLFVWVTDDDRHMPVQMESEIKLGTIRAELISHTP